MDQTEPLPAAPAPAHAIYLQFIPLLHSAVIQRLLVTLLTLVAGNVGAHIFAPADYQQLVSILTDTIAGALVVAAGQARITKPNPPIAPTQRIATALNQTAAAQHVMSFASVPTAAGGAQFAATDPIPDKETSMSKVFLGGFAIDLLTAAVLEHGTNGDKSKQAARASEALTLIGGAKQLLNGDVVDGINTFASAIQKSTSLSIGESMALQNLIQIGSGQVALLATVKGVTLLGEAETAIVNSVLDEMTAVCNKYIGAAPAAAKTSG